jgi:oligoendopeptidase F
MIIASDIKRNYLAPDLVLNSVTDLDFYYSELLNRKINSKEEFEKWLFDRSELESFVYEDSGWRYIRMTINTLDETAAKRYEDFVTLFEPVIAENNNKLNEKTDELQKEFQLHSHNYDLFFRNLKNELSLFRKENIPVNTEINKETQRFSTIAGALQITYEGKTYTLPQAAVFLKNSDRELRKTVFELVAKERHNVIGELNGLYDNLVKLRDTVAKNAGFENYRDYKFKELARLDYTVNDCYQLHKSIEESIVPLVREFMQERKQLLKYDTLRPWDLEAEIYGSTPLKPFIDGADLAAKTIRVFNKLDPYFSSCIETMQQMGHFDLESKKGKAPGGYNYPLYESGVPFIFMNAVGTQRDMVTMVHEGGHAVHSFLSRHLKLTAFKSLPSEIAELASMTMELITMDHWNEFYMNEKDCARAKKEQLEKIITILPWIAIVDKFQHVIYENPVHTHEQRNAWWQEINERFSTKSVDYTGYEWAKEHGWQKQLHIFEVPFYYIEYAIAQLGAIAMWRNFKNDSKKTIEQYKAALALGNSVSIPEIYKIAGIKFDMSPQYVAELATFVKSEYDKLKI